MWLVPQKRFKWYKMARDPRITNNIGIYINKKAVRISNGFFSESGKRDLNSRPQPWQGCALPTELFPHFVTPIGVSGLQS